MSKRNNPKRESKMQIGGFRLSQQIRQCMPYLVLTDVRETWKLVWRGDSAVGGLLIRVLEDGVNDEARNYLHLYFCLLQQALGLLPDVQMFADWSAMVQGWVERNKKEMPELTEDEWNGMIAAEKAKEDVLRNPDRAVEELRKELEEYNPQTPDPDINPEENPTSE